MRRLLAVTALVALNSTAAFAQTTTCSSNSGYTTCHSTPALVMVPRTYSADNCAAGVGMPLIGLSRSARRCKAIRAQQVAIGNLVADGKCAEARQAALRSGDMAQAEQIQTVCVPVAPPAQ